MTQTILQHSIGDDLPRLNQLILERERIIEACQVLDTDAFTLAQKAHLRVRLESCQALDLEIEQNMNDFKTRMGQQLRHLRQSQNLLGKYQSPAGSGQETHNEDA
ncbi:hypothetical protein [Vampirovibrio chlorellavorus]|uniref:hypothetical protein n=1 Tax=Vampirovibrio chlorellavorus TaxID=758823 RepID=UPI0026F29B3A|nr:hypothetical protein [Vampirovibrio chlorellavorus]